MLEPTAEPCLHLIAEIVKLTKLLEQYTKKVAKTAAEIANPAQATCKTPSSSKRIVSPEGEAKDKYRIEELFTKALIQAINIKDCGLQPQEDDLFKKHLQIEINRAHPALSNS